MENGEWRMENEGAKGKRGKGEKVKKLNIRRTSFV
jgi:hypothetical protein